MGQAAMIAPIARQEKLCASCPAGPKRQLPAVSGSPGKRRPYRRDGIGGLAAVRPAALRHIGTSTAALAAERSEEHTSELQSLMRISYAVFCLKKNKHTYPHTSTL